MSRGSIAVVVVTRRHPDRVPHVLKSAEKSTTDETVVVNLTGEPLDHPGTRVVDGNRGESLSHAVSRALEGSEAGMVWILRDDTVARPGALGILRTVLESSPSVGVVGPKQMMADAPSVIRELGESVSAAGFALPLAEREFDQSQFDRMTDVLAVGEAGMLVRREVWDRLGGFDESLAAVDGALDFCFRARSAGWLVEAAPAAVIETAEGTAVALLGEVPEQRLIRERAYARAHRVQTYVPAVALPFRAVVLFLGSLLRGFLRFISKAPHPFAEWSGTFRGIADIAGIARSRRSFRAIRTHTVDRSKLFITRAEVLRRRAMEREALLAEREAGDVQPRLHFGVAAFWWTIGAALCGFVITAPLWGSVALVGGAALPLPTSLSEAWSTIGSTWSTLSGGVAVVPDGFRALLGIVSTLTWWNPNVIVIVLFLCAIPLSFLAGYHGAGALTTNTRTALVMGAGWALLPTLTVALGEGRLPAILAHIAIPFFVRALRATSIVALGWTAILAAVLWVSVPVLAPLIVLAIIVSAFAGRPAVLLTLAPALALEWPRILESMGNPVLYFADRGVPFAGTTETGLSALTLTPGGQGLPLLDPAILSIVALSVTGVFTVLAIVGMIASRRITLAVSGLCAGLALLLLSMVGRTPLSYWSGETITLYPGPLFDVVWWSILSGTAIALTRTRFTGTILTPVALLALGVLTAGPAWSLVMGDAPVHASTVRTLPAYVEAETAQHPGDGTLVLTPRDDGMGAVLERGHGLALTDFSPSVLTRTTPAPHEDEIAKLSANLIADSGFDLASAAKAQGVRFVLLDAEPTHPSVSVISSHAGMSEVGATDHGVLWLVNDAPHATPQSTPHDNVYRIVLGIVGILALIAAVPTSLPRRPRTTEDDPMALTTEDDDERS